MKRPCSGKLGHMTIRTAHTDVKRPPPLKPPTNKPSHTAHLKALKEQFQRDVDDTVAQILSGKVCTDNGINALWNLSIRSVSNDLRFSFKDDFNITVLVSAAGYSYAPHSRGAPS